MSKIELLPPHIPPFIGIFGVSGSGKTTACQRLMELPTTLYIIAEIGLKRPAFATGCTIVELVDPASLSAVIEEQLATGKFNALIVDTYSSVLSRYESDHVLTSSNTQDAWGKYGQFHIKSIGYLSELANAGFNVIVINHKKEIYDKEGNLLRSTLPLKGAMANYGVEATFNIMVECCTLDPISIAAFPNPHLVITPREQRQQVKHCFKLEADIGDLSPLIKIPTQLYGEDSLVVNADTLRLVKLIAKNNKAAK